MFFIQFWRFFGRFLKDFYRDFVFERIFFSVDLFSIKYSTI